MLIDLHVENFALLDRLDLSLEGGLIVLTGETGAGKSIVVDAINLLLGERANSDVVRAGADKAVVQGVFDVAEVPEINRELESLGFQPDELLYISREVNLQGRSQCRINGRIAPVNVLREITQMLADVHGQHEHQLLLSPKWQLSFLDGFAGQDCIQLKNQFTEAFSALEEARRELRSLDTNERERAHLLDLYRYQVSEIEKAALRTGEKEELQTEMVRLANLGKLFEAAIQAHGLLYGEESFSGALPMSQQASRTLEAVSAFDPEAASIQAQIGEAVITLGEAAEALRKWRDSLDTSPERLDEVQSRLELIDSLTRKYGDTIEEVLAYKDEKAAALEHLERTDVRRGELEAAVAELSTRASSLAGLLTAARKAASARLGDLVSVELQDLGMPDGQMIVQVEPAEASASGADLIIFLFSANPGELPRPLAKVASGGELSRAMLALKSVLVTDDPVRCLVFDEIDSGVGGRTANKVGEKLKLLAVGRQVLCVTHLAQIARFADIHVLVSKHTSDNRAYINAAPLAGDERVEELARMLGGDMESEAAVRHARELLSAG